MGLSSTELNRLSWNSATDAHNSHKGDQAAFLKGGGSTLFPDELALLGDVNGKSLVHLQCNSGQDSLSLVQLGAKVTGVDISDTAIAFAQALSKESGLPATFIRADLLPWMETTSQRFDIVFASYGALCWMPDLNAWAKGVSRLLKPGGKVVVIEFHPILDCLDEKDASIIVAPLSGHGKPVNWDDGVGDYVSMSDGALNPGDVEVGVQNFENPHACHEFIWSQSDILGAVAKSGLCLEEIRDYPYSNGFKPFEDMKALDGKRWAFPDDKAQLPLMFGWRAKKH